MILFLENDANKDDDQPKQMKDTFGGAVGTGVGGALPYSGTFVNMYQSRGRREAERELARAKGKNPNTVGFGVGHEIGSNILGSIPLIGAIPALRNRKKKLEADRELAEILAKKKK